MSIAALVVSLPERRGLLYEAIESISDQTRQPDHLLIGVDYAHVGEVANQNRLITAALESGADWLAFLHDDDLWLPDHLAAAEKHFDTADVIVSRVTTIGRPQSTLEPQHDDFGDLLYTNWFPPSAVVVRAETFGRWTDGEAPAEHPQLHSRTPWIDWTNWRRLYTSGARMVHTNQATCLYRFGDWDNGSWRS